MAKRILLADDSITIQKVIELTFSDEDFEVVTVGNGRLAIERLAEVRPDVVLCDIIMPERDGYEVCDFVKRHQQFGHVPVLLLTGAFEPFDQERAQRVGADGYLAKPFEPETLIAKVKDLLARQSQRAASRPSPVAPPPLPPLAPAIVAPPPPIQRPVSPPASAIPLSVPQPAPVPPPVQASPTPFLVPPSPRAVVAPPVVSLPPNALIPEEPFAGLDPNSLGGAAVPATFADVPPMPEVQAPMPSPEATPLSAEETASLVPPPVDDGIFFRTPADSWSQPTAEVPLEERARASLEAPGGNGAVFEEIVEEEVLEVQTGAFTAPTTHPPVGFEALVEDVPEEAPAARPLSGPPMPAQPDEGLVEAPPIHQEVAEVPAQAVEGELVEAPAVEEIPSVERETPPLPAEVPPLETAAGMPQPISALAEAWMEVPAPPPTIVEVPESPAEASPEFIPLEADAHFSELVGEEREPVRVEGERPPATPLESPAPIPIEEDFSSPEGQAESVEAVASKDPEPPMLAEAVELPRASAVPGGESSPPGSPAPTEPAGAESWADIATSVALPQANTVEAAPSVAGAVGVAPDTVQQIAQRVIAQVSEKVIREIAWEVIPELAEALIKREIERLKSELQ